MAAPVTPAATPEKPPEVAANDKPAAADDKPDKPDRPKKHKSSGGSSSKPKPADKPAAPAAPAKPKKVMDQKDIDKLLGL